MDEAIGYFLELRIRFRRNPEARAIVDRCLGLIAAAQQAEPHQFSELEAQVDRLRGELVRRFGEKEDATRH